MLLQLHIAVASAELNYQLDGRVWLLPSIYAGQLQEIHLSATFASNAAVIQVVEMLAVKFGLLMLINFTFCWTSTEFGDSDSILTVSKATWIRRVLMINVVLASQTVPPSPT
jgi:hypothetical protein